MQSFIDVAPDSGFPLENLPWGVFSTASEPLKRIGVAVGDHVVDVSVLQRSGLLSGPNFSSVVAGVALQQSTLNAFMALGKPWWQEARTTLQRLLSSTEGVVRDDVQLRANAIIPKGDVSLHLPADIGDYTDFYTSRHHAFNVGALFRGPGQELQPNWVHLPVGYHGRASSIVVSGQSVRRPWGQVKPPTAASPSFVPCRALDFELEMGAFIGPGNTLGDPVPIDRASDHIFGYVLLNDWSARDIQAWEYVPLGPFNGKNFCTQISPWVVTRDALAPFSTSPTLQDPQVLPYLTPSPSVPHELQDIHLSVDVIPAGTNYQARITKTNLKHTYWTFEQMIAHHTAGGCNLRPGDILGSGTLSGPEPSERACLLELTGGGKQQLQLTDSSGNSSGVTRTYLQDGDTVVLRGWCEKEDVGYKLGFGECRGTVLPAHCSLAYAVSWNKDCM